MKLYYSPGACSLAPHIVARELGLAIDIERVDNKTKTTATGENFLQVNAKGYVPALRLDDGTVLTEGPVISQYLADRKPGTVAPAAGTMERYRVHELQGFINSELHKPFGPLFDANAPEAVKAYMLAVLNKRFTYLDGLLAGRDYLTGATFTIADAYLFVVSNWAQYVNLDLSGFANLQAFLKRVGSRPAVQAALKAEGLLK